MLSAWHFRSSLLPVETILVNSTHKSLIILALLAASTSVLAQDEVGDEYKSGLATERPIFGGPTSPEGQIERNDRVKDPAFRFPGIDQGLQPWFDMKRRWNEDQGVAVSGQYSLLGASITETNLAEDSSASAGVMRLNLRWTALNRGETDNGSLFITLDHRHSFSDTAPADLAGSAGYIGVGNTFFNDLGGAIINLNWQQGFNDRNTGLIVGRFDPNDYQVIHGYSNPWSYFSNIAFTLDLSVALPDSSWGIGGGHWLNDQFYLLGAINDANGSGGDDLEWFEGGSETFQFIHGGWSPSKGDRYFKNISFSVWQVDDREARSEDGFAGVDGAEGYTLSANWLMDELWMPFFRYGKSTGDSPIYNESVTLGILRSLRYRSDVLGLAVNWGQPPDDELDDQTTVEAFWQFQFSQNLEITPSIQYLKDPALNPEDDELWQASLRAHLTF